MTNAPHEGDITPDRRAERIPNPEATSLKGARSDDVYPDDWPPELPKRALETSEHKPAETNCGGHQVGHQANVGAAPCLWADRISAAWRKSAEAFIETGHLLNTAKEQLSHGDWMPLVRELPFSERTAQMLMRIARDKRIANPQNISYLPPSWSVLHELTKLDDQTFSAMLSDGSINPSMTKLVADNGVWLEKHRKGVRLKKLPKKFAKAPPKKAKAAPPRPQPLSAETAKDLHSFVTKLAAYMRDAPPNVAASLFFLLPEERRELAECASEAVAWLMRIYEAASPKKEADI